MSYNVDAAIECVRLNLGGVKTRSVPYGSKKEAYDIGFKNLHLDNPYVDDVLCFLFDIGQADARITEAGEKEMNMFKVEFEVTMNEVVAALDVAVDCMNTESENYRIVETLYKNLRDGKIKIVEM